MALCPNGHDSTWDDYCSTCGSAMGGGSSVATSPAPDPTVTSIGAPGDNCPNCGETHGPDDVFCESCGLDFATGTLPDDPDAAPAPTGSVRVPTVAVIRCDRVWFDATIGDNDLDFPDPEPAAIDIELLGAKALVGRHSASRGVFPEIDVRAATGDPAVSSRHAMIEHDDDGNWTVTDLGSTNGTKLGDPATDDLVSGQAVSMPIGTPVLVGAWTSITLEQRTTEAPPTTDPGTPEQQT